MCGTNALLSHLTSVAVLCFAICYIWFQFPSSNIASISSIISNIFNYGSAVIPADIYHVNTTQFKQSINEIAKLAKIDFTPTYQLSTSINSATSLVRKMKHKIIYALSKTDISQEFESEILHFFDTIVDQLTKIDYVADNANKVYHEHNAKLEAIYHSLKTMQRGIKKSNLAGFVQEIAYIIQIIEESADSLTNIKRDLLKHRVNMQQFSDQAHKYENEIYQTRDKSANAAKAEAKTTERLGVVAGGAAAYFVNPLLGIGIALYGALSAHDTRVQLESTLYEFENSANMFEKTSTVLDDCIDAISVIVNTLNSIVANLREIAKQSDRVKYKLGRLENAELISEEKKDELCQSINFVASMIVKAKEKYDRQSPDEILSSKYIK